MSAEVIGAVLLPAKRNHSCHITWFLWCLIFLDDEFAVSKILGSNNHMNLWQAYWARERKKEEKKWYSHKSQFVRWWMPVDGIVLNGHWYEHRKKYKRKYKHEHEHKHEKKRIRTRPYMTMCWRKDMQFHENVWKNRNFASITVEREKKHQIHWSKGTYKDLFLVFWHYQEPMKCLKDLSILITQSDA